MTPETRQEIEELLPFYANGTLDGDERAKVETALAEEADLRAELEVLVALRETMQAEEMQSPGELGLARLMRDLDREAQPAIAPAGADNVVPLRRLRVWQIAAAVVLALGVAQSAYLIQSGDNAPAFELASGEEMPLPAAFTVGFAPDATEAEIRAVLTEAQLQIVAGPSTLGLYDLAPWDGADPDAAEAVLAEADADVVETWNRISP